MQNNIQRTQDYTYTIKNIQINTHKYTYTHKYIQIHTHIGTKTRKNSPRRTEPPQPRLLDSSNKFESLLKKIFKGDKKQGKITSESI